jgi:hypothetical protein
MAWAFINMMPTDDLNSAAQAAARVPDPRLATFHDSAHALGRAMARSLGWKVHVAWDTYFIFRPGILWRGPDMPSPDTWFHQLKNREMWEQTAEAELGTAEWTQALADRSEADPSQFRTGNDLRIALESGLKDAAAHPLRAPAGTGG